MIQIPEDLVPGLEYVGMTSFASAQFDNPSSLHLPSDSTGRTEAERPAGHACGSFLRERGVVVVG